MPDKSRSLLRVRKPDEHSRVTFIELFFDLVFVFAVTQLSHALLGHLTPLGALETLVLFLAVWWAWIDTSWVTNWLDPERTPVRLLLLALMLVGLALSTSIPEAFGSKGLFFALAYTAMQLGRSVFMLWALGNESPANTRNFYRIILWQAAACALWIAGGLASEELRIAFWIAGLALESMGPILGFVVPGLGRSETSDWDVEGGHMAERNALFIIIALGESILVTGATFSELEWSDEALAAFAVAFVGSVTMWWIYFDTGADLGSKHIAHDRDPGRIARLSYTYLHILIVAGVIITAVGDEIILTHPDGHMEFASAAVILGGPALYLFGNFLFKHTIAMRWPLSHLVGLVLLGAMTPFALHLSPLTLSALTTLVLVIVGAWETKSLHEGRRVRIH